MRPWGHSILIFINADNTHPSMPTELCQLMHLNVKTVDQQAFSK